MDFKIVLFDITFPLFSNTAKYIPGAIVSRLTEYPKNKQQKKLKISNLFKKTKA